MCAQKKKNVCDICQKTIIGSIFKFKSHLHSHNAVQPRFQCSYCGKNYYRRDNYTNHVNTHLGIVPKSKIHICDHCERSFVNKRNLIIHLSIHDDVPILNRFKCNACTATYCEKRLLQFHIRKVHFNLNEKKYSTDKRLNETWIEPVKKTNDYVEMTKLKDNVITIKKCSKKPFKTNKNTKKEPMHNMDYIQSAFANTTQTHYSKAICDYCNKEMLKKSMRSHIRERHLKLRRFKCEECNVSFSRHYQLVNHACGKTRNYQKFKRE